MGSATSTLSSHFYSFHFCNLLCDTLKIVVRVSVRRTEVVQVDFMSAPSPFRQSHRTELSQALGPRRTLPHCCFHISQPHNSLQWLLERRLPNGLPGHIHAEEKILSLWNQEMSKNDGHLSILVGLYLFFKCIIKVKLHRGQWIAEASLGYIER